MMSMHDCMKSAINKLNNNRYLVIVVLSVEKWLFLKDHTGQHAAQAPHV